MRCAHRVPMRGKRSVIARARSVKYEDATAREVRCKRCFARAIARKSSVISQRCAKRQRRMRHARAYDVYYCHFCHAASGASRRRDFERCRCHCFAIRAFMLLLQSAARDGARHARCRLLSERRELIDCFICHAARLCRAICAPPFYFTILRF